MAIIVNNLQRVISEVMAAIDTGVLDASGMIGSGDISGVRPPEKVIFDGDIILELNGLSRNTVTSQGASTITTDYGQVVTKEDVYLDGVYNHTDVTTKAPHTKTDLLSATIDTKITHEDQSINMILEYPGPKSK